MYKIDRKENRIHEIEKKSFTELGYRERAHLQEWLANHPSALGEELLIIQKEFHGFGDTQERLDLLAFDKLGHLVIIENKLDDTGRDVTWQALKYASYCSTLSTGQIADIYQEYLDVQEPGANAKEKLDQFFEQGYDDTAINTEQRIILVAAKFRKEVTSTVIWLSRFNIKVSCFKATVYEHGEFQFLSLDQIIPVKEAEDYVIRMAEKAQQELSRNEDSVRRYQVRKEFWSVLLNRIKGKTSIFQNNNPTKDSILYAGGTTMTYVSYVFIITKNYCSVGLKMYREEKEENKFLFDLLSKNKTIIEQQFGGSLEWLRSDDNVQSSIMAKLINVNVFDRAQWDDMIDFMTTKMVALENTFRPFLVESRKELLKFVGASNNVDSEIGV